MPSNDTANIYSSEYRNGGTPSTPTTAADVTYDNTASGLTADDVQEAIDEVAGKIADLSAEDVAYDNTTSELTADDVQAAIDEVDGNVDAIKTALHNRRIWKETQTVTVTADGVKTVKELMVELVTAFNTFLDGLTANQFVRVVTFGGAYTAIPQSRYWYSKTTKLSNLSFVGMAFTNSWQTQQLHVIRLSTTDTSCYWLSSALGSSSQSFSDSLLESVLNNGLTLELYFDVYDRL